MLETCLCITMKDGGQWPLFYSAGHLAAAQEAFARLLQNLNDITAGRALPFFWQVALTPHHTAWVNPTDVSVVELYVREQDQ